MTMLLPGLVFMACFNYLPMPGLILAFKNEDADSKSRAMLLIGVSAALIGISAFIDMVVGDVL